jgi:hypothetical protein
VSGGKGSHSGFGLYVGADGWVTCHHYDGKTPILVIDAGDCSVSISPATREASEAAVEFARALARNAQEFADDIERLHAERPSGADISTTDDAIKATGSKAA